MSWIKRIVFVEPNPPDVNVFSGTPLPRLGTVLLCTILKKHGYDVKSYVEVVKEIDLHGLLSADVVGISTTTSTAPRAYEIATMLRGEGIAVFMGGPHVTYLPDEALAHCDFVLRGEADETILSFIAALESGSGFNEIPGLSYRVDDAITHNRMPPFYENLDLLPIPDLSVIHGLEKEPYKKLSITPVMTSRGCPFDCHFCSVTGMFGQKYRFRSKGKVIEELRIHKDNGGTWVFFYDDNFTAHAKRTKELLREMIAQKLTPHWTAQVRVEVAKDKELIDLMRESGCHTVYIGFESINPATLKAYNKKQDLADIEACIKVLHKNNIRIHGMFVFGSDHDTKETIRETRRFAKKNKLESVQFLILTPLPGTGCYRDLEKQGRILTKDWSLYDAHHVVYEPTLMSPYELQSETFTAMKSFYSIWEIIKSVVHLSVFHTGLKWYGHSMVKQFKRNSIVFVEHISRFKAGTPFNLSPQKTAGDLKQKLRAHNEATPGK
ncbi:MAG: B12-binding domain-containing radical SAM protein [Candidatus Azambacteria bacterium]|nr:B12-binding domain-containing radical SAM protein [Candidatus Azambacteria bacterium]